MKRRSPPAHGASDQTNGTGKRMRDGRTAALRETAQMNEWLSKEDYFVFIQAMKRALIRFREKRSQPSDSFAVYLELVAPVLKDDEDDLSECAFKPFHPISELQAMDETKLSDLHRDCVEFSRMEGDSERRKYWHSLTLVAESIRTQQAGVKAHETDATIHELLERKSGQQLDKLKSSVKKKLENPANIDVDYWTRLLKAIELKSAQVHLQGIAERINSTIDTRNLGIARVKKKLSPELEKAAEPLVVVSKEKDFELATLKLYRQDNDNDETQDEGLYNVEADYDAGEPLWRKTHPHITPQKPKYFNRVIVGYEWSAYNKIHYKDEERPPKVVWGYKFNIFYPNLLLSGNTPSYKVEAKGRRMQTDTLEETSCIVRFRAGPPYQDICFEIVDKDWDHSARFDRGFKCSFDKGILQLHFKFKKIPYAK